MLSPHPARRRRTAHPEFPQAPRSRPRLRPRHLIAINTPSAAATTRHPTAGRLYREAVDRLRALPALPPPARQSRADRRRCFRLGILVERPAPRPDEDSGAVWRVALPDYFRAMGMRARRGRDFDARYRRGAAGRASLRTMARRFWPRRLYRQTLPPGRKDRVDDRHRRHRRPETVSWSAAPDSEMYILPAGSDLPARPWSFLSMTLVLRTAEGSTAAAALVRARSRASIAASRHRDSPHGTGHRRSRLAGALDGRLLAFAALALVPPPPDLRRLMSYIVTGLDAGNRDSQELGARQSDVLPHGAVAIDAPGRRRRRDRRQAPSP